MLQHCSFQTIKALLCLFVNCCLSSLKHSPINARYKRDMYQHTCTSLLLGQDKQTNKNKKCSFKVCVHFLYLIRYLSFAIKLQLNWHCPSFVSLPLSSCLTSFHSLHRLYKKTAEGGVHAYMCTCVCVCECVSVRMHRLVLWFSAKLAAEASE